MKRILILLPVILFFATCKKSDKPTTPSSLTFNAGHGVFIVNQGIYTHGDASVSYLNLDSNVIHNNIYGSANGGVALGDVAQSMTISGGNAYVVVNNSQRIEYVSANTFKVIASINAPESPRYLLGVNTSKAYITDLSSGKISILNTQSNTITGSITVPESWTEQMVQSGTQVFVTAPGGYDVFVINSQTDMVMDSISLGMAPTSICMDKNGKIWVYCVGNSYSTVPVNPSLFEIDPSSHSTIQTFNFLNITASEGNLCMDAAGDSLFFIHGGVYRMAITDANVPTSPFIISGASNNYYGLLKVPDGRVLVADALNYSEDGDVYIYSAGGSLLKTLGTGAASPSDIVYY